jgi:hypothetical protein
MRKFAGLLVIVLGVGAASFAVADDKDNTGATAKTGISTPGQTNQINKQVGFIDLYLTNAMNDAKVLTLLAEGEPAAADKALLGEAQKNLNSDLNNGLTHVQKLRTFKSQLGSMASGVSDKTGTMASGDKAAKVDEIEQQFKDAKIAAGKLANVKAADLSSSIDGVSTHLMGADSALRDIAKWTNYTRLSSTNLGMVPVRGTESGAGTSRDLDRNKAPSTGATPSPDMTTPGAMPPTSTMPPRKEPVQPAPGGNPPH